MTGDARKKLYHMHTYTTDEFLLGSAVGQSSNLTYYDIEIIKSGLKFFGGVLHKLLSETFVTRCVDFR